MNLKKDFDGNTYLEDWHPMMKHNLNEIEAECDKLNAAVDDIEADIEACETDLGAMSADINDKVNRNEYASTEQAGIIKLKKGSAGNYSGLVVEGDGSVHVYTKESTGTKRSGDGSITVVAATNEEIDAKQQKYKPIVPATLEYAVQSVTDAEFDSTSINPIQNKTVSSKISNINSKIEQLREAYSLYVLSDYTLDYAVENNLSHLYVSNKPDRVPLECHIFMPDRDVDAIFLLGGDGETEIATIEYAFKSNFAYIIRFDTTGSEVVFEVQRPHIYSTTPQRVGTWVDGTPIWRFAFDITFTSDEEDMFREERAFYPSYPVKDANDIWVVNECVMLKPLGGSPCIIDDVALNRSMGGWYLPADFGSLPPKDESRPMGVIGWIEFVTAEDNLKTE